MKNILLVLVLTGLYASLNAIADVLPSEPFCSTGGYCSHPDLPDYEAMPSSLSSLIRDIKGAVKKVQIQGNGNLITYEFNRQGLLTNRIIGNSQLKLEYDASNRLVLEKYFESGKATFVVEFKYFDDQNMVTVQDSDHGKWNGSSASVHSQDADGNKIFYYINSSKNLIIAKKYVLSADGREWERTDLKIAPSNYPANKAQAEIALRAALNCLQGTSCENGYEILPKNIETTKSKQGEFDKFTFINSYISWSKNGLIYEQAGWDAPLADGTMPHRVYKFQFDSKINWIKRDQYINDIPATITDNKPKLHQIEEETVTRKIEYY